jgi:hypothetical protein
MPFTFYSDWGKEYAYITDGDINFNYDTGIFEWVKNNDTDASACEAR